MDRHATAFAPATVANLGAGYDILGLAVDGPGDEVSVQLTSRHDDVNIVEIVGDDGRLPRSAEQNAIGIAARQTLALAGVHCGVELTLKKGLGIGTGLGSSAASAAAAAYAVNLALGKPLRKLELVGPCLDAEALVSGRHADNVAPALLGGLVLVKTLDPLTVIRLPIPNGLALALVTPQFEVETKGARAIVPSTVELSSAVAQSADLGAFVAACYSSDLELLGRCIRDRFAAPPRLRGIPGAESAIVEAYAAGALGASLSGSGPTVFAVCRSERIAEVCASRMGDAFQAAGLASVHRLSRMDCPGVRAV
ncbi:MAG: homoserine kinase [Myxococcota bacterium]|nr:homoserine kinase [Myxococcota bacterium]